MKRVVNSILKAAAVTEDNCETGGKQVGLGLFDLWVGLANVGDDVCDLLIAQAALRRHVAISIGDERRELLIGVFGNGCTQTGCRSRHPSSDSDNSSISCIISPMAEA